MADTDNVTGITTKIKEGIVRYSRPVSEAFGQLVAGNINQLIDDVAGLDGVVNVAGDIDWTTQTDDSIPRAKVDGTPLNRIAVNISHATTTPTKVYDVVNDGLASFVPTDFDRDGDLVFAKVYNTTQGNPNSVDMYGITSGGGTSAYDGFSHTVHVRSGDEIWMVAGDGDTTSGILYIWAV